MGIWEAPPCVVPQRFTRKIILYIIYTCEADYNTALSARHRAVLKELSNDNNKALLIS